MRLFFAIPLPADVQVGITGWRDKYCSPMTSWVSPTNYHITLAFLGNMSEHQLDRLLEKTDGHLADLRFKNRSLVLNQSGFWAKTGIFWIGPSEWPEELTFLSKKLYQIASQFGAKKDNRSYQPHVTLARKCTDLPTPLKDINLSLPIENCVLYESINGKNGVSYHPIAEWPILQTKKATNSRPYRRR